MNQLKITDIRLLPLIGHLPAAKARRDEGNEEMPYGESTSVEVERIATAIVDAGFTLQINFDVMMIKNKIKRTLSKTQTVPPTDDDFDA